MKKLSEQANSLVKELQIIADNLAEYNPGLNRKKVPLSVLQYDIACLGRDLTWLYTEIGAKIKDEADQSNR